MKTTRCSVLVGVAALAVSLVPWLGLGAQDRQDADLTGSWQVRSGMNAVVLSLESTGRALVMMLDGDAFSTMPTSWKALPGGVLVEGLPRFRLWAGADDQHLRAAIELPAGADMSDSWRRFPEAFSMSRIADVKLPAALLERPLPVGWEKAMPGDEWQQKAGRRRRAQPGAEPNTAPPPQ